MAARKKASAAGERAPRERAPRNAAPRDAAGDDPAAVDAFVAALDAGTAGLVRAIRRAILGADGSIREGIQWNSPSFWWNGWFATMHVRPGRPVQVVLHHGAKGVPGSAVRSAVADPAGLLQWKSPDRAIATFADAAAFGAVRKAFTRVVADWARYHATLGIA